MKKLTILIAAVALVCFSVPAMAADWNFYGNARMATYYTSEDLGDGETFDGSGEDSDAGIQWDLQSQSRIGAKVKAENISGEVQLRLRGNAGGDVEANTALVYGVWNFGSGTLKVGKDYTPVSQFISGQVFGGDLGLLGVGTVYGNRVGQVAFGFGGFEIALMTVDTRQVSNVVNVAGITFDTVDLENGDVDRYLPKVEASWGMSFDAWSFGLQGGFQTYEVEDVESEENPGSTDDIDVTSWTIGGDVGFNFGPGYVKAALSYGQNVGSAGWNLPGNYNQGGYALWDGDDDTNDVNTLQGALVAGMKVSDMLSFEAGFGYRQDDADSGYALGDDNEPETMTVYLNSVIALAPGVFIIPEVGYIDQGKDFDDSTDLTTTFYLGGKWQINF